MQFPLFLNTIYRNNTVDFTQLIDDFIQLIDAADCQRNGDKGVPVFKLAGIKAVNEQVKRVKHAGFDRKIAAAPSVEEMQRLLIAKSKLDSLYITI